MVSCLIPVKSLSALMTLASTSAAIMHDSIENRQPWRTQFRAKDITERFLFSLFDTSIMSQIQSVQNYSFFNIF